MSKRKEEHRGAGLIAAENYAQFFLGLPAVATVWLFGKVSLTGDGHDVDLVLEVTDPKMGFEFLIKLKELTDQLLDPESHRFLPSDDYEVLSTHRRRWAYSLLSINTDDQDQTLNDIAWLGKFQMWDRMFKEAEIQNPKLAFGEKFVINIFDNQKLREVEKFEEENYRPLDLFLMPPGWQDDSQVRELLPNWVSERPWAKRQFYNTLVLQSRRFNSETKRFDKRKKGARRDELLMRQALREEEWNRTKQRIGDYLVNATKSER
jgi:hypothetical protein